MHNCSNRPLKQQWTVLKQNLFKSHLKGADRYSFNRLFSSYKEGDVIYSRIHPVSHAGKNIAAKLLSHVRPFQYWLFWRQ